jgi:hypothetical protein
MARQRGDDEEEVQADEAPLEADAEKQAQPRGVEEESHRGDPGAGAQAIPGQRERAGRRSPPGPLK